MAAFCESGQNQECGSSVRDKIIATSASSARSLRCGSVAERSARNHAGRRLMTSRRLLSPISVGGVSSVGILKSMRIGQHRGCRGIVLSGAELSTMTVKSSSLIVRQAFEAMH